MNGFGRKQYWRLACFTVPFAFAVGFAVLGGLNKIGGVANGLSAMVSALAALILAPITLREAVRQLTGRKGAAAAEQQIKDTAKALVSAVLRQWEDEASVARLNDLEPLPVSWTITSRPVRPTDEQVFGDHTELKALHSTGTVIDLAATFMLLPARQLVVLGAPGSGKSTAAVLLVLDLLRDWTPDQRVPVLLPIHTWDPDEAFDQWLARRLGEEYVGLSRGGFFGVDLATQLVEAGQILPVLDGLDEIPEARRMAAVVALRKTMLRKVPLVVTARPDEFEEVVKTIGETLGRGLVVELVPLTTAEKTGYLSQYGERWDPVIEALEAEESGPVAKALSTPLMIYLARMAMSQPGVNPEILADRQKLRTVAAIEGYLLDQYLPAMYQPRTPPPRGGEVSAVGLLKYSADDARQWLTFAARHLSLLDMPDLAWWQLARRPGRARGAWPMTILTFAAAVFLPPVVAVRELGWGLGWPSILAGAVAMTLLARFITEAGAASTPRQAEGVCAELTRASGGGALLVLPATLAFLALDGPALGLMLGIAGWFAYWGIISEGIGVPRRYWVRAGLSPRDSLKGPRSSASAIAVAGVCLFAVVALMLIAVSQWRATLGWVEREGGLQFQSLPYPAGVSLVLLFWVIGGVALGFTLATCVEAVVTDDGWVWWQYQFARVDLVVSGNLPWCQIRFFDDARRRGVLRQAGSVYQFRHARLQKRLAESYPHEGTKRLPSSWARARPFTGRQSGGGVAALVGALVLLLVFDPSSPTKPVRQGQGSQFAVQAQSPHAIYQVRVEPTFPALTAESLEAARAAGLVVSVTPTGSTKPAAQFGFPSDEVTLTGVRWSAGGATLAVSTEDEVVVWRMKEGGRPSGSPRVVAVPAVHDLAFSPDGRYLATVSINGPVTVWNLGPNGRPVTLPDQADQVDRIAFSPDGAHLVTAGSEGLTRIWTTDGSKQVAERQTPTWPLGSGQIAADGDVLVLPGARKSNSLATLSVLPDPTRSGTVQVVDLHSGRVREIEAERDDPAQILQPSSATLIGEETDVVDGRTVSPDGTLLATMSRGYLQLWDVRTSRPRGVPVRSEFENEPVTMSFSVDSTRLTIFGGGRSETWRVHPHAVRDQLSDWYRRALKP